MAAAPGGPGGPDEESRDGWDTREGEGVPDAGAGAVAGRGREDGRGIRDAADVVRLRLVEAADRPSEADLLRLALQQAVAALGGFGGLAHLSGAEGVLRLAAVNGLPTGLAHRWNDLPSRA
ncbi:MAG: hypothetical protein HOY76_22265, partial [Streptomyces sp.]|nr:hypothetical protein [Streptomyces sp.]